MFNFFKRKPISHDEQTSCPKEDKPIKSFIDNFRFNDMAYDNHVGTLDPYTPPHGIIGNKDIIAQDCATPDFNMFGAEMTDQVISDGLGFMGYTYLAQMAQRAEFRKPCDVLSREVTREWITIISEDGTDGDDKENNSEVISQIEAAFKKYQIRKLIREHVLHGLIYGIGHIFINAGGSDEDPLKLTPQSIGKGSLKGFKVISPVWTAVSNYEANDATSPRFFRPDGWWVLGNYIHHERLLQCIPYPVSDIYKPAFNFGGLSLTQQMRAHIHNYLRTRNSVANITANASKLVLKTDMAANMGAPQDYNQFNVNINQASLQGRAQALQNMSEGMDTIICDQTKEDISIVSTTLSGLSDLQGQAMEAMASIPGIPLVKLFGIQPSGLNASSDGEIRVFYDEIASFQEAHIRPVLEKIFHIIQLDLWGEINPTLTFKFNSLYQLSDTEKAQIDKTRADMDAVNIQAGVISPQEARERLMHDGESAYSNIDLSGPPPEIPEDDPSLNKMLSEEDGTHEDVNTKDLSLEK